MLIPLNEVLRRIEERGYDVSLSSFRYYVKLGLISKSPKREATGSGRGSKGLYDEFVVDEYIEVKRLQEQGLSLEDIKNRKDKAVGWAVRERDDISFSIKVPEKGLREKTVITFKVDLDEDTTFDVNIKRRKKR